MAGIDKLVGSLPPEFERTSGELPEREKVTIARIECGPRAHDTKVILSNGTELDRLTYVNAGAVSPDTINRVTLTAILEGADNARTDQHD